MDALCDIQKQAKRHGAKSAEFKPIDDLTNFCYDRDWISAPTAFGDTYKYSVEYTIGDYNFKYSHISGCDFGSLLSPTFTICNGEVTENFDNQSKLLKKFLTNYDNKLSYNDYAYGLFGFLNAFTLGQSVVFYHDKDEKIVNVHYELPDLEPINSDEDSSEQQFSFEAYFSLDSSEDEIYREPERGIILIKRTDKPSLMAIGIDKNNEKVIYPLTTEDESYLTQHKIEINQSIAHAVSEEGVAAEKFITMFFPPENLRTISIDAYPNSINPTLGRDKRGIIYHLGNTTAVGEDKTNEQIIRPLSAKNIEFLAGIGCTIDDSLVNEIGEEGIACEKLLSLLMSTDKKA